MELELAITSYQRLSPTVVAIQKFSSTREYLLGRSRECDWYLPDPDRVISSRHAQILCRDGDFLLKDLSTNGVYLNDEAEPVGNGQERALHDGDRLRFGDYQFSVMVRNDASGLTNLTMPVTHTSKPSGKLGATAVTSVLAGAAGPTAGIAVVEAKGDSSAPKVTDGINTPISSTLASGLGGHSPGDSHVEMPAVAIPPVWEWGKGAAEPEPGSPVQSAGVPNSSHVAALFEGLGMPQLADQPVSPAVLRELGELSRIMLGEMLDLLHLRAVQKQKLRVQQTLFQRRENNPLKFSATPQDAIDALLLRRHDSFLGPRDAVTAAFQDIKAHDRGLMAGIESVISELLDAGNETTAAQPGKYDLLGKSRAWDRLQSQRQAYLQEYGDSERMLRSDAFVEAYERTTRDQDQE